MIADWAAQLPVLFVAVAVAFVPGLLALAAAGLRGLALIALAPLMSTTMAGAAAILIAWAGFDWSALSFLVMVVAIVVVAFAAGRLLAPWRGSPARIGGLLLPAAIGVGIVLGAWRIIAYIGDPSAISQTNDAVFHLNALRSVLETNTASAFDLSRFVGGSGFYPAAWHALASLIALITGAGPPTAANALTLVIAAVIWPVGLTWFASLATGSKAIACYTAILSGVLQAFPLLLFQWGVLYPNALSVALLPAAVGAVRIAADGIRATRSWRSVVFGALLVGIALGALLLSQPAAALAWGLLVMIWFSWWMPQRQSVGIAVRTGAVVFGWIVLGAVWLVLSRSTSGSHWPPFRGKGEVWLDLLLNSHLRMPATWGISILMIIGLIAAARNRDRRWMVAAWLGLSALYVLVAAIGAPAVRDGILGAWYADPYRIAALTPIIVIPLAAVGADAIVRFATRTVARGGARADAASTVLGFSVLTLYAIAAILLRPAAMPEFIENTLDDESRYAISADTYLSVDERVLLESLGQYVGDDARVIGNPGTGTAFGFMLSGVDVYPRTWSPPRTAAWELIAEDLNDAADMPAVCTALGDYGDPQYVLDFGPGESAPGRFLMPGMTGFAGQDGFEEVARVGDASLWRITACAG